MDLILEAILWSTFVTLLSQAISIGAMWFLGLPPRKLAHVIEDEQNIAVGASFFIITLIAAFYIGLVSGDGYDPADTRLGDYAWIFGGVALALTYTLINFWLAHRMLDPIENENVYQYIRRELIDEGNASLALFLGGLAVAPFIATVYQIL